MEFRNIAEIQKGSEIVLTPIAQREKEDKESEKSVVLASIYRAKYALAEAKNLDEVIEAVKKEAKSGDVVLLSPASASFDWFSNYKDRGQQFKEKVKNG